MSTTCITGTVINQVGTGASRTRTRTSTAGYGIGIRTIRICITGTVTRIFGPACAGTT
jgi:hypothetical protein